MMSHDEPEQSKYESQKPPRAEPEIRYVPLDVRAIEGDEDEIDLIDILKTFWDGRKIIVKTVAIFIVLGLAVALFSVEEYTSEVKLLPETRQESSLGALGGLAQQFGFSAVPGQTEEGLSANLYPSVIQSNVFLEELMHYEVLLPGSSQHIPLEEYIKEHQQGSPVWFLIRLPFTIKNWLMNGGSEEVTSLDRAIAGREKLNRLVSMPKEDWETLRDIRERIVTNLDSETGVVTVSVKMQDPVIAAAVADEVVQKLSEYITEKRTEKARRDVEFIEERFEEARGRFEEAQKELASFNDANRGQLTAMARTEEQLLQSRYNLNFNLYNSMAERLEEARIHLQEETPVINILEPAAVPDKRSEPNRTLILIVFMILGGLIGIGIIFVWPFYKTLRDEIQMQ